VSAPRPLWTLPACLCPPPQSLVLCLSLGGRFFSAGIDPCSSTARQDPLLKSKTHISPWFRRVSFHRAPTDAPFLEPVLFQIIPPPPDWSIEFRGPLFPRLFSLFFPLPLFLAVTRPSGYPCHLFFFSVQFAPNNSVKKSATFFFRCLFCLFRILIFARKSLSEKSSSFFFLA